MAKKPKDGGPAFPQGHPEMCVSGQSVKETQGMSLRDWFAGKAMQGWIASFGPGDECSSPHTKAAVAKLAYGLSDAMLAAREGKEQS